MAQIVRKIHGNYFYADSRKIVPTLFVPPIQKTRPITETVDYLHDSTGITTRFFYMCCQNRRMRRILLQSLSHFPAKHPLYFVIILFPASTVGQNRKRNKNQRNFKRKQTTVVKTNQRHRPQNLNKSCPIRKKSGMN
jgi:hypothetical protein